MDDKELEEVKTWLQQLPEQLGHFLIRLGIAVLIVFVAFRVIKVVVRLIRKSMEKTKADPGVTNFTCAFTSVALKVVVLFLVLASIGVNTASIVALLGTAGVAIGLALQGSLSNLAGGVMILALRPFKIGDYIREDSKGHEGNVAEISLFTTKLLTYDNKVIVLPNGDLANTSLTNFSEHTMRMLEVKVGISYHADLDRAKEVLMNVIEENHAVLKDEPKVVYVDSLGDSAVVLGVRCWVPNKNVLNRKWEMNERVKKALDEAGIEIPYPQRVVTLKQA